MTLPLRQPLPFIWSSGENEMVYTIKQLAELIKNKTEFRGKIFFNKNFPNGVMNKNLSFSRIKKLGWKPSIKLKDGIDVILNNLKF